MLVATISLTLGAGLAACGGGESSSLVKGAAETGAAVDATPTSGDAPPTNEARPGEPDPSPAEPPAPGGGQNGQPGDSGTANPRQPAAQPTPAPPAQPDVPSVDVVVLSSGATANLRSLATPGKPTLIWFWAPHCSFCRREAPDLLSFSAAHGAKVAILGVGAQDSLSEAHDFVGDTSTAGLKMTWDSSGRSWRHYRVTNQPTVIVLGADGRAKKTWFREFKPDEILAAAGVA